MSSDDELYINILTWSDVELLQSVREGEGAFNSIVQPHQVAHLHCRRGRTRHDRERWIRRRCYTLCDLRISIQKQGNSPQLISYKTVMSPKSENGESAFRFGKFNLFQPLRSRLSPDLTDMLQISSFNQSHILLASDSVFLVCLENRIDVTLKNINANLIWSGHAQIFQINVT